MEYNDIFDNMYITYYYGGLTGCTASWKAYDKICTYSKFYYIISGECELDIEGEKYRAAAGDIFLIPSGIKHSFYHINDNLITKYWFHFNFKTGNECFVKKLNLPYMINIGIKEDFVNKFKDIFRLEAEDDISSQLACKSGIIDLVSMYTAVSNRNTAVRKEAKSLKGLLAYISDNLDKHITLNMLAERIHLHPNYFIKFFKENVGISPIKYINRQRVERAKILLESTDMTISEIMVSVGFSDLGHFSKFFKANIGYSPKQFREFFKAVK